MFGLNQRAKCSQMQRHIKLYRPVPEILHVLTTRVSCTDPTFHTPSNAKHWMVYVSRRRIPWWRHQMETFSALLAICVGNSPVPGEFPAQRPVTWSFDAFFDLRLNKRLSKQSWGWWFETLSRPLWRHRNAGAASHGTCSMKIWRNIQCPVKTSLHLQKK